MTPASLPAARLATRLAFLVAGFGIACWAPLVPFAKERLSADDGTLGLLLLCVGVGSVVSMSATGAISARYGSRPIIVVGGFGMAGVLPLLALADTVPGLAVALFVLGGSLGSLDVAMNVHAVEVEKAEQRPLMSGFHALYSVGGFLGASVMTLLLSARVAPLAATLLCSALMAVATAVAWPRLLRGMRAEGGPLFAVPRGVVLLMAGLAAVMFLAEGAVLDWSALLITDKGFLAPERAGLGYMLFASAMTVGRFAGDYLTARTGDRAALFWGGCAAALGFAVLLAVPAAAIALSGFVLIGLGASNIVPILFRLAGTQRIMPPALAIAAVTTVGYAGIMVGPAGIGFAAKAVGLPAAFWGLAALVCLVPLSAAALSPPARAAEQNAGHDVPETTPAAHSS